MRRLLFFLIICLLISLFAACSRQPGKDIDETSTPEVKANEKNLDSIGNNVEFPDPSLYLSHDGQPDIRQVSANLYFYDEKNNRLVPEARQILKWNETNATTGIIYELVKGPKDSSLKPVISPDTKVIKIEQTENILSVNLSGGFLASDSLMIARAALVNTLTGLEGLKYIKIYVEGRELTSNGKDDGIVLGLLTRYPNSIAEIQEEESQYIEGAAVRRVNRELFFPDANGIYLLSEVRAIAISNGDAVRSIVEELIKGPASPDSGLYPSLPKGTKLNNLLVVDGQDEGKDQITLYFSKEFKSQFDGGSAQETATLGSLVYSLTSLPNIGSVKIYYQNEKGYYTDAPLHDISLRKGLTEEQFPDLLGKRIRVYFPDKQGSYLIPEYRAMLRTDTKVPERILEKLLTSPTNPDSKAVLPDGIPRNEFKIVKIIENTAIVNLPSAFFGDREGNKCSIQGLYAIVNSLTDPVNTRDILQVRFIVDNKIVDEYMGISLDDPFVPNPALTASAKID